VVGPYSLQVAGDPAGAARQWDDLGCPYDAALALLDATDEALLDGRVLQRAVDE